MPFRGPRRPNETEQNFQDDTMQKYDKIKPIPKSSREFAKSEWDSDESDWGEPKSNPGKRYEVRKSTREVKKTNPDLFTVISTHLQNMYQSDHDTYRTYEMKKVGDDDTFYWGSVANNSNGVSEIWSPCKDGSGLWYRNDLPANARSGRWEYRGSWVYTSVGPNKYAAQMSANFAAVYRRELCELGGKIYPDCYPSCFNEERRGRGAVLFCVSLPELTRRLFHDISQRNLPSQIVISHSPLVTSEDVTCEWIPCSRSRQDSCQIA